MPFEPYLPQPVFDNLWIAQHEANAAENNGIPPNIFSGRVAFREFASLAVLDDELSAQLEKHLQESHDDLVGRYTVLHFLRCIWTDIRLDEYVEERAKADARNFLIKFLSRLEPDLVRTAPHAMWELKQAWLLREYERLGRLCQRYARLAEGTGEDEDLLLGRAYWLWQCEDRFKALPKTDATDCFVWEAVIEGHTLLVSSLVLFPPEAENAEGDANLIDAKACFEKAAISRDLGVYWGLLADCAAKTSDPGRAASIWEDHWKEIIEPFADTVGVPVVDLGLPEEWQFQIADLWERAGRTDKEIQSLELLRANGRGLQWVNERLARIYFRQGDDALGYARLREAADCDPALGEDTYVSAALRAHFLYSEMLANRRKQMLEGHGDSPAISSQRGMIQIILQLCWKPFSNMSERVREDWIRALLWCYGDHGEAYGFVERASWSVFSCNRAFESHLRERLFDPLRDRVVPSETVQLPDHMALRLFLEKGKHIGLGKMLDSISAAHEGSGYLVFQKLWTLLRECSSAPFKLREGKRWQPLRDIRNPNDHDSRRPSSIEEAKVFVALCQEFVEILEDAPKPSHTSTKPGRPQ
jgi:hypothetical protein